MVEVEAGEVAAEVIGEAVSRDSPDPPQAASQTNLKTRVRVSPGAPDTPPTHQSLVAAAIIDTGLMLGSVLHPSPVHGSTSVLPAHEGQTSLENK